MTQSPHQDLLDRLVVAIDRRQRRRMNIHEFSNDPRCILRLGIAPARTGVELADGTVVHRGDTVGILHLWNEQMPRIPPDGPDLAWAKELKRSLVHSFRLLASHVAQDPALADIQAISGDLPLVYTPATIRMLHRVGLTVIAPPPPPRPREPGDRLGNADLGLAPAPGL